MAKRHIKAMTIAAMTIMTAMMLGSCSNQQRVSTHDLQAAQQAGHERALEFKESNITDTFRLEDKLIDIRIRETRLRNAGYAQAADAFISSFLATLDSVNPKLSSQLREP